MRKTFRIPEDFTVYMTDLSAPTSAVCCNNCHSLYRNKKAKRALCSSDSASSLGSQTRLVILTSPPSVVRTRSSSSDETSHRKRIRMEKKRLKRIQIRHDASEIGSNRTGINEVIHIQKEKLIQLLNGVAYSCRFCGKSTVVVKEMQSQHMACLGCTSTFSFSSDTRSTAQQRRLIVCSIIASGLSFEKQNQYAVMTGTCTLSESAYYPLQS